MPYLKIQTNLPLTEAAEAKLMKSASALVATELGKPETYVMIALEPDIPMLFAGTDAPTAFLELKGIGLPTNKTKALSQALCRFIEQHLGVPGDRVYLNFADVSPALWGWNSDVF